MKYLVFFLMFGGISAADAQPDPQYYVGGFIGWHGDFHSLDATAISDVPACCRDFGGSTDGGVTLAADLLWPLRADLALQARLGYANWGAAFAQEYSPGKVLIDGQAHDLIVEQSFRADIPMLYFEPGARYSFTPRFYGIGAVRLALPLSVDYSTRERIVAPQEAVFENGSAVRNDTGGSLQSANSLHLSAVIGLGYSLPLGGHNALMPEFRLVLPLSSLSEASWKPLSLQVGAGYSFAMGLPQLKREIIDTVYQRDTTVVQVASDAADSLVLGMRQVLSSISESERLRTITVTIREHYRRSIPRTALRAELSLRAGMKDGSHMEHPRYTVEEFEYQEQFPLLPYIFFPHGEGGLAESGQVLLSPREAAAFSEQQLPRASLDLHRQLLNIIGYRLRRHPDASLIITGCNSGDSVEYRNESLSFARAHNVMRYLRDTWGIADSRLRVIARNLPASPSNMRYREGREENQRVELSSFDPQLFETVSVSDVTRQSPLDALYIGVDLPPELSRDTARRIAKWLVEIRQDDSLLWQNSGSGAPRNLQWRPGEHIPPGGDSLAVRLFVEDNHGERGTIRRALPVNFISIQKKRAQQKKDKRLERYRLIVFDYDKAELSPHHREVLRQIGQRITPGAVVTITGYADRTGNTEYNRDLALRRCRQVQTFLGLADERTYLKPVGSDELLFNNDRPEGRFFSRTVVILVEIPIAK